MTAIGESGEPALGNARRQNNVTDLVGDSSKRMARTKNRVPVRYRYIFARTFRLHSISPTRKA